MNHFERLQLFIKNFQLFYFRTRIIPDLCTVISAKLHLIEEGADVVMIVWELDLQLPMQSVPITTKVVSSNSAHGEAYTIQHYVCLKLFCI